MEALTAQERLPLARRALHSTSINSVVFGGGGDLKPAIGALPFDPFSGGDGKPSTHNNEHEADAIGTPCGAEMNTLIPTAIE